MDRLTTSRVTSLAVAVAILTAGALARADGLPDGPAPVAVDCHVVPAPVYSEARHDGVRYLATGGGLVRIAPATGTHTQWTTCNGLPSNTVLAVAAGPEGVFLAFRGQGVWRFEPETGTATPLAETSDPRLRWARALALGDDGTLLAGTVAHGLLAVKDGRVWHPAKRLARKRITALAVDRESGWVLAGAGTRGLYRWRPGEKARRLRAGTYVRGLTSVAPGRARVRTAFGECEIDPGESRMGACEGTPADREDPAFAGLPSNHVTALAVHDNRLWIGTLDAGVVTFDGAAWAVPAAEGEAPRMVKQLVSTGDALWAATPLGAYRLHEDRWERVGEHSGLLSSKINTMLVDGDAIWFGTDQGVSRLSGGVVRNYTVADGLPHRIVHSLARHDGAVYAGTLQGLAVLRNGMWSVLARESGALSDNWINALGSNGGELLAGTYDAGIDRVESSTGRHTTPVAEPGPVWVNPHGFLPVGGAVYVATLGDGLLRMGADGRWVRWVAPSDLPSTDVTAVALFDGRLWVGTRAGLAAWRGDDVLLP